MSKTSPEDLVVAFHSVARRLGEAQGGTPSDATAGPTSELRALLAEAGRLLGTTGDPDRVADAIHAMPADEWSIEVLDRLREIALDIGRLLRHIASLADGD